MKVTVKTHIKFPNLNLQKELIDIANQIIVPDIDKRMLSGKDLTGSSYPQNSSAWTKRKAKLGLQTGTPLTARGDLRRSFKVKAKGQGSVIISPEGVRRPYPNTKSNGMTNNELADILQNRGLKNGRHYEFFGISELAERKAIQYVEKQIKKRIDAAKR